MKKFTFIISCAAALAMSVSCANLDLNPPSAASSENWYSTADEIRISLNDFYRTYLYQMHVEYYLDRRCDDWAQRDQVYDLCNGSTTSTSSAYAGYWLNSYKGISRANRIIAAIDASDDKDKLTTERGEACFFRAFLYARLALLWGDVPFYIDDITIEQAFQMGRVPTATVYEQVYKDFAYAINNLPDDNTSSGIWRVNKYVAKAMKARLDINLKKWSDCAKECQEIMDSGMYKLYYSTTDPKNSYGELAADKTMNCEFMWVIPYCYELGLSQTIKSWVIRTAGGNGVAQPSWDLLAAYECTDGKGINESPLFDHKDPYKNRDPRCAMTFVVPGTTIYGVEYNPSPVVNMVLKDGQPVKNQDMRVNNQYCAYDGTALRKGSRPEWRDPCYSDNPWIMIRYADVMLMYAEAKVEMNEIDGSVLNAINDVRARAYGVKRTDGGFPAVTITDQAKLRQLIRNERRVEFAWEGRRWFDVRRWGWLEKMYSHHYYGFPNGTDIKKFYEDGNWYWPETPVVDEFGFADFSSWPEKYGIQRYGYHVYNPKIEFFPIPNEDILVCPNLTQNPGY